MKRNLRIGRLIERTRWRDRLGLTEMINLHHPRRDRALGGLPHEASGKPGRKEKRSKGHQPPIPGLDAGRADSIIPNLRCLLVGRDCFRRAAVMHGGALEHHCPPSDRSTEDPPPALSPLRTAWVPADMPWLTACVRFMRRAHAGAASGAGEPPAILAAKRRNGLTTAEPPTLATPLRPPAR